MAASTTGAGEDTDKKGNEGAEAAEAKLVQNFLPSTVQGESSMSSTKTHQKTVPRIRS